MKRAAHWRIVILTLMIDQIEDFQQEEDTTGMTMYEKYIAFFHDSIADEQMPMEDRCSLLRLLDHSFFRKGPKLPQQKTPQDVESFLILFGRHSIATAQESKRQRKLAESLLAKQPPQE